MANHYSLILLPLAPYLVGIFFSLLVAVAWTIAFVKLKHVGALVLALASLLGSILTASSAVIWLALVQGQRQLTPYLGIVSLGHTILVGCLTIAGAFLMAFHRPEKAALRE